MEHQLLKVGTPINIDTIIRRINRNNIGVDVDSKLRVCKIRRSGKDYPVAEFDNSPAGHRKFIRWATKHNKPARVVMEATGVYSVLFALALHQTQTIEGMVANPKVIKNFANHYSEAKPTQWMRRPCWNFLNGCPSG